VNSHVGALPYLRISLYPDPMALYAAYAGNLDPHRMAQRAPASPPAGAGWLRGWRLTFAGADLGWQGPLATVVECTDIESEVFVMLYEVTESDEQSLDEWEGVGLGFWRKVRVRVDSMSGSQIAWLYVLDAYEGGLPTRDYIQLIADAAHAGGAPADYIVNILDRPCQEL
jgi:gamma-glutamylcyclotransferase (GGCT)/AIG2-like uncharacterized protein YtfP